MARCKLPTFLLLVAALALCVRGASDACATAGGLALCPEAIRGLASEPSALVGGGALAAFGAGSASLLQTSAAAVVAAPAAAPATAPVAAAKPPLRGWNAAWKPTNASNGIVVAEKALMRHVVHPFSVDPGQLVAADTERELHELARFGILPVVGVTMTAFLLGSMLSSWRYTSFIPETLCTVGVAVFLGVIIRHMIHYGLISDGSFVLIDATILSLFLLPIIIFEGGWFVSLPHFVGQFRYIMIFAIMGTMISIFMIGTLSSMLGAWGLHPVTDPRANFAFASLISATDPVATLATFAQLKIAERQPMLNTLVFGESMINDAVAIVVFNAVNYSSATNDKMDNLYGAMLFLFVGSTLLGAVVAAALVLPLRFAGLPGKTLPEVFYIFLTPYLVYALAETLDLSGIIACLFAGIVFRLYGAQHLTEEGVQKVDVFLETMGRFADSGVFILCGCSTALIDVGSLSFCVAGLVLCLFARAVLVQVCGWISNVLKRRREENQKDMITWKHKFIIWLSGLRGGIGLMLALEIDEKWCGSLNKERIINTTFFLVCTLLFLCGSMTEPCLTMLGMAGPKSRQTIEGSSLGGGAAATGESSSGSEDFNRSQDGEGSSSASSAGNWLHQCMQYVLVGEGRQR